MVFLKRLTKRQIENETNKVTDINEKSKGTGKNNRELSMKRKDKNCDQESRKNSREDTHKKT